MSLPYWLMVFAAFAVIAREAMRTVRGGTCLRCGGIGGHRHDCPDRE